MRQASWVLGAKKDSDLEMISYFQADFVWTVFDCLKSVFANQRKFMIKNGQGFLPQQRLNVDKFSFPFDFILSRLNTLYGLHFEIILSVFFYVK